MPRTTRPSPRPIAGKDRSIFEHSAVSLWEEDISGLRALIREWQSRKVSDLHAYLLAHPSLVRKGIKAIRVVDVNEATLRLYGAKSRKDLLGPLDITLDAESLKDFIELFVAVAEGRALLEQESSALTLSGKRLSILLRAFIPAEKDAYHYMLVNVIDVTEHKELEKRLIREQAMTRTVIDSVPDHIFVKDRAGRFTLVNKTMLDLTGRKSPEEIIGKTDHEVFPQSTADRFRADDTKIMKSGRARTNFEEEIFTAAGARQWVLTTKVPLRDSSGKVTGIVGVARDITERRKLERRIEEERSLLREVITNVPDGIFLKDREGRFIVANRAIAELMQEHDPEMLIGKTDFDFYPNDMALEFEADEREVIGKGEKLINHEEPRTAEGTLRWILTTKVPVRDAEGTVSGLVGITRDISSLKEAEAALRQSEEDFRAIFMDAPVGIFRSTFDGKLITVNPAFARMLGYDSPEHLIETVNRKSAGEVIYADPTRRSHVIEDIERTPGWLKIQNRYRHRNGRVVIVNLMTRVRTSPDSSRNELEGFAEDITDRVRAEEELSRQRALLVALLDSSPDSIYFKDRDGRYILNNNAHAAMLGARDPAEMRGKTDLDYFPPAEARESLHDEQLVMQTRQPLINKVEKHAWLGRPTLWVAATKTPLKDENGEIVGTFGISRDITEGREIEEKNLRLAEMVDSSNDAIIGMDTSYMVTSWNKGAEKVFGYTAEEVFGTSITRLLPPELLAREPEIREKVRQEGNLQHLETSVTRKDGKTVYVSTSISLVKDGSGQTVGVTCIARDVTAQRALEVQIIRAQRLESLGTLAAGIAHQFNNINTAVKGYLDFVSQDQSLPAGARSYIKEALKAVQRAVDITERLQGLTSASVASPERITLDEAVRSLLPLFEKQMEKEGISITVDLGQTAPILASHGMLSFVLASLISNSIHALIDCPSPAIAVRTRVAGDFSCLEVSDTGCGISPDNTRRIFTPFFTTKGEWAEPGSSQARVKGIGLSLSVCQSAVAESGGWIEVESTKGTGTTFRVFLPAAAPEEMH